jgi:hypothetical protein
MQFYQSVGAAVNGYMETMSEAIAQTIRTLLETKHLYQSVMIDEEGARERFLHRLEEPFKSHCLKIDAFVLSPSAAPWRLSSDLKAIIGQLSSTGTPSSQFNFTPPDVKMYCCKCDRLEPYNLVSAHEPIDHLSSYHTQTQKIEQVYTFTLLCQACKKFPEVVMVRRVGGRVSLAGKTPMEHVAVPKQMPKEITSYYSGSVIAFQSGQFLAANFMLRTACEQWVRQWAVPTDRADAAIEKYMESLPQGFSAVFPSIRLIYEKLSEDIHSAAGSEELYKKMLAEIDLHFQARSIFPGVTPPQNGLVQVARG